MKLLLLHNDLVGYEYCELYAGGASVALSLLYDEYVGAIHINDIDKGVSAFWEAVLNHTDALCRRISDEPVDLAQWRRQRAIQRAEDPELLDLAFSTFFLNRTNRSGIIKGGVIGGKGQSGRWKIDARYNREELIYRIQKVARFRSRITLTTLDASAYLTDRASALPSSTIFYLDPPYFIKGSRLYTNFYREEDHEKIAAIVSGIRQPWIVSYDHAPNVEKMYLPYRRIEYGLSYSAADRYRGREVMFFSPGLKSPNVESPANIYGTSVDRAKLRFLSRATTA